MTNVAAPTYPRTTIELVRVYADFPGAFRLRDAGQLENGLGQTPHWHDVEDNTFTPIPHGSIEQYARHLAQEWGDDAIYVAIYVTTDYFPTTKPHVPFNPQAWHGKIDAGVAKLPAQMRKKMGSLLRQSNTSTREGGAETDAITKC